MFVYNIWDIWLFAIFEAIISALPYIGIGILIAVAFVGLVVWLNHLDKKYWHTKSWPLHKQLLVALLIVPVLLIVGLVIILLFA